MKKKLLSLVAIAIITLSSFGQAPEGFKYQAVVRDVGNTILNNQAVGLRMTIQQGSIGGTTVYAETFAMTTNPYGLVNLEIGNGTVISGTFANIDWSAGPYFMETAIDVTGGTNYSVMGTSQLMSVPYALYAKTSGNGQGPAGPQGIQGPAGPNGVDGAIGATGPTGPTGPTGLTGAQGIQGVPGSQNAWGLNGNSGTNASTNFIGTTDAQDVIFRTNNLERVRLSSNGNLGIGTTLSPVPITFNGGAGDRISFFYTSPTSLYGFGIQNQLLQMYSNSLASDIAFGYGSSSSFNENFRIKGNGNVGVGTISPTAKFHVNNDVFGADSSFVIKNSGYVGIGTDTPVSALTIVSKFNPLRLKSSNDGCYVEFFTPAYTSSISRAGWIGYSSIISSSMAIWNQTNNGRVVFATNNLERMSIDSIGRVGIGTATPNFKFHIQDVSGGLFLDNQNALFNRLKSTGSAAGIGKDILINTGGNGGLSPDIYIKTNGDGASNVGYVGIGIATPARPLHIKDVMRLEPRSTAPTSPVEGDIYFDTTIKKLRVFDGTIWQNCW